MPNMFPCPRCHKEIGVDDSLVGHFIECPSCGETFAAMHDVPADPIEMPPRVGLPVGVPLVVALLLLGSAVGLVVIIAVAGTRSDDLRSKGTNVSDTKKSPLGNTSKLSEQRTRENLLRVAKEMGEYIEVESHVSIHLEDSSLLPWHVMDDVFVQYTPETRAAYQQWRAAKLVADRQKTSK